MTRDTLFKLPRQRVGEFAFDQSVVEVFPDMIARSVPGYASVLSMIEQLTARFAKPATHLYDLGCSLGSATRLMLAQAPSGCVLHAVDNSPSMIERLKDLLAEDSHANSSRAPTQFREQLQSDEQQRSQACEPIQKRSDGCQVEVHLSDVCDLEFCAASFVVLNWTLQFIPVADRRKLLKRIYDSMVDGGALLMSEKISFDDSHQQLLLTDLHHDFKRAHGYSELEIAQKRTALEDRLIPETLEQHCQRLREIGFEKVVPWFQCFNFASILAVK